MIEDNETGEKIGAGVGGVVGTAGGATIGVAAVSAAGIHGLSGLGIISGLTAIGGTAVGGIVVIAAGTAAAAAVCGYLGYKSVEWWKNGCENRKLTTRSGCLPAKVV